jgi:uncharacterized protein YcbX
VIRFRPNIVVRGGGAFGEDVWTEIGIGSDGDAASKAPGILLVKMCDRCTVSHRLRALTFVDCE